MSIFSIGIAGMNAQSSAIEVTSANVANASTVGYKSARYDFVSQFYGQLQSASPGETTQQGLSRSQVQGSIQSASSPLDLAIQGDGMFRLTSTSNADSTGVFYSRDGQFSVDSSGNIVNANGLFLTGYQPTGDLSAVTDTISALKLPPSNVAPAASTKARLDANLDARVSAPTAAFDPTNPSTYTDSTAVTVYDAKGVQHTLQVYFRRIADATVSDSRTPGATATAAQYDVYLQGDGTNLVTSGTGAAHGQSGSGSAAARATTLQFVDGQLLGSLVPNGGTATPTTVAASLLDAQGGTSFNVNLDLSSLSSYGSSFQVRSATADGRAAGTLSNVTVDNAGRLYGQYTNGDQLLAGQLALASFAAPQALALSSSNVFAETYSSGPPTVGKPLSGQFGTVLSSSLEQSNIDMAQELVQLMIEQRNYQANAQSFKAANDVLTTTIQLG